MAGDGQHETEYGPTFGKVAVTIPNHRLERAFPMLARSQRYVLGHAAPAEPQQLPKLFFPRSFAAQQGQEAGFHLTAITRSQDTERHAASGPLTPFPSPPDAIADQARANSRSNAAMAGGEGAE